MVINGAQETFTGCYYPAYTIQPVVQPAVSCKQTFNRLLNRLSNGFDNRFDNRVKRVTGQLADTPTRGLDDLQTGHLADWSTRGLDNSRTGQVADWTTRGCHRRLCVLSFPFWRHLRDRELSSPRVDQSTRCPVRELAICKLAYSRVVQLPLNEQPLFVQAVFVQHG